MYIIVATESLLSRWLSQRSDYWHLYLYRIEPLLPHDSLMFLRTINFITQYKKQDYELRYFESQDGNSKTASCNFPMLFMTRCSNQMGTMKSKEGTRVVVLTEWKACHQGHVSLESKAGI